MATERRRPSEAAILDQIVDSMFHASASGRETDIRCHSHSRVSLDWCSPQCSVVREFCRSLHAQPSVLSELEGRIAELIPAEHRARSRALIGRYVAAQKAKLVGELTASPPTLTRAPAQSRLSELEEHVRGVGLEWNADVYARALRWVLAFADAEVGGSLSDGVRIAGASGQVRAVRRSSWSTGQCVDRFAGG